MKKHRIIQSFPLVLFSFVFLACNGPGSYYGPMMSRGRMYSTGGPFMGLLWFALLLLIGFGIYYFIKNKDINKAEGETPLDILKKRYASGEITKEEYKQMKADIS